MHIIIEGPDGAGKTTLARQLCSALGMKYHHEGPPPAGADVAAHYRNLLLGATEPTVFDRFYLGETVYGPLLRGGCALSTDDLHHLGRFRKLVGVRSILCLPPFAVTLQNTKRDGELIKDPYVLEQAFWRWHGHSSSIHVDHVHDYTMEKP